MTSTHVFAFAALFSLLIPCTNAGNYQPLPGSFRPPSLGGTSQKQAGTHQGNSPVISAPSQQQAWTSQPYGGSPNYYLPPQQPALQYQQQPAPQYQQQPAPQYQQQPAPQYQQQPAPQYQQQNAPSDNWGRSININPGNFMTNVFGSGNDNSSGQPPVDYLPNTYQAPAFQQPIYYGSSYPLQYGHTPPPLQQPPAIPMSPSQPAQQPAPFEGRRPFGGKDMRFRPPELKGSD